VPIQTPHSNHLIAAFAVRQACATSPDFMRVPSGLGNSPFASAELNSASPSRTQPDSYQACAKIFTSVRMDRKPRSGARPVLPLLDHTQRRSQCPEPTATLRPNYLSRLERLMTIGSHRGSPRLVLLCQWFDVVVEIIGFFKNDSFLKTHVISIRYYSL
jgi:hypothetical protein